MISFSSWLSFMFIIPGVCHSAWSQSVSGVWVHTVDVVTQSQFCVLYVTANNHFIIVINTFIVISTSHLVHSCSVVFFAAAALFLPCDWRHGVLTDWFVFCDLSAWSAAWSSLEAACCCCGCCLVMSLWHWAAVSLADRQAFALVTAASCHVGPALREEDRDRGKVTHTLAYWLAYCLTVWQINLVSWFSASRPDLTGSFKFFLFFQCRNVRVNVKSDVWGVTCSSWGEIENDPWVSALFSVQTKLDKAFCPYLASNEFQKQSFHPHL